MPDIAYWVEGRDYSHFGPLVAYLMRQERGALPEEIGEYHHRLEEICQRVTTIALGEAARIGVDPARVVAEPWPSWAETKATVWPVECMVIKSESPDAP